MFSNLPKNKSQISEGPSEIYLHFEINSQSTRVAWVYLVENSSPSISTRISNLLNFYIALIIGLSESRIF